MPRYYDDVVLGEELGPLEKVVTVEAVREFSGIWRGNAAGPSFFIEPEVATRAGLSGVIVPGPMSMAFMAQLLSSWAEGGRVKRLDVVFRQTVPHDKPLRVVGVVTDRNQADGEHRVECDVYLETADGDRLVAGQAIVVLPARP